MSHSDFEFNDIDLRLSNNISRIKENIEFSGNQDMKDKFMEILNENSELKEENENLKLKIEERDLMIKDLELKIENNGNGSSKKDLN